MKIFRVMALGAALAGCGAAPAWADADADRIADVQAKISALEPIVEQDEASAPSPAPANIPETNIPTATAPVATNAPPSPPATVANPPATRVRIRQNRAISYLLVLRNNVQREDYTNAMTAANNLAVADANPAVQKVVAAIVPELQQLHDAKQAVIETQLKQLADQVTEAILAAKEPKDLDALVVGIDESAAQARTQLRGTDSISAYTRIEEISRYAKNWQRYLSDLAAGNAQQGQMDLRMLSDTQGTYAPIPRSQLLTMEQGEGAGNMAPVDVKIELRTTDDIPAAIAKLQEAQPQPQNMQVVPGMVQNMIMPGMGGGNPALNILIDALQSLQSSATAFNQKDYSTALHALDFPFLSRLGNVALAGTDKVGAGVVRKQVLDLKEGLLIKIAQGLLALPNLPAAQPGERALDYLARAAAVCAKAADWAGLQQVLTVTAQVAGPDNAPPVLQEDTDAVRAYLIGQKLESAGQTLDAIRAYRQSLATLGKYFPADPPAARLKDLAAKFPQVYQQAIQQPIAKVP